MKKFAAAAVTLLMVCFFAGCQGGEQAKDIDVTKLADDLKTQITYQDELSKISDDMFATVYKMDMDSIKTAVAYASSGATAEEIVVVEANSADDVDAIKQALDERVAYLKAGYEDYGPQEVPKIDNAVIKTSGNYAAMCISDDSAKAEEVINSYFG